MNELSYLQGTEGSRLDRRSSDLLRVITLIASCVDVLAVAAIVVSATRTTIRPWLSVSLALLTVAATHRESIFGDETALNGSMVILVAAAGTFAAGGGLWLPVMCGLLAGFGWDHIREGALRKLVVNSSCTTLAVVVASELGRVVYLTIGTRWLALLASAVVAATTYWLVNNGLVALILTAVDARPLVRHLRELTRSETFLILFALGGFFAGYYALHETSVWISVSTLVGVLALADLMVVRRHDRFLAQQVARVGVAGAVLACVVGAAAFTERAPNPAMFVVLIAAAGISGYAVERIRAGFGFVPVLTSAAAACIVFHTPAPVFAPLTVAFVGLCVVLVSGQSSRNSARAAATGGLALTAAADALPQVHSLVGCVGAGVVMAVAALVGWHAFLALQLRLKVGRSAWLPALDVMGADAPVFLLLGFVAAVCGWAGLRFGFWGATTGVCLAVLAAGVVAGWRRAATRAHGLSDDQLVDVVRSALLDLPGSRFPDDL